LLHARGSVADSTNLSQRAPADLAFRQVFCGRARLFGPKVAIKVGAQDIFRTVILQLLSSHPMPVREIR
jgi:hypothetical protein